MAGDIDTFKILGGILSRGVGEGDFVGISLNGIGSNRICFGGINLSGTHLSDTDLSGMGGGRNKETSRTSRSHVRIVRGT